MNKLKTALLSLALICALSMGGVTRAGLTTATWELEDVYLDDTLFLAPGAQANHTVLAHNYTLNWDDIELHNHTALAWMVKLVMNATGAEPQPPWAWTPQFTVFVVPNASEPMITYAGNFTMHVNDTTRANYHLDFNSTTPTYLFHWNNTLNLENVSITVYCELWGLQPPTIPRIPFLGLEWVLLFALVFILVFAYVRRRGR